MVTSEREMVRSLEQDSKLEERFTSLQPTYEDSVPTASEDDWELERD